MIGAQDRLREESGVVGNTPPQHDIGEVPGFLAHPLSFDRLVSTTVPFMLLSYGRMLWGGEEDGSKGVFLQERVPSGGRMWGTNPASVDPIAPPLPEAGSSSARVGLPEGSHRRRRAQERMATGGGC